MELNTVLSIAIPVIGFFAFLSGYFFGKSDGIKKCRIDKYASNNQIYEIGFHEGKIVAVNYFKVWAENYLKKLMPKKPQHGIEPLKIPELTCKE